VKWHRATPVRTSLTLGTLGGAGARHALFFGDMQGFVTALDAATGEITWRERVGLFDASMLTGAIAQHGSTLYVPVSSIEVGLAANPAHECCRSHGAVRALDATNGAVLWTHRMTPDAAPTATNSAGVMQWGPSGAPVWSAPTVDAARGVLYVGTGENYSSPATDRSDAIVALDLATGAEKWHFQARVGDVYNMACDGFPPGPNCPSERGPDFDFGAAVIVTQDSRGRSLLLAGQKSGDVWALDPDDAGRVVWNRRLGAGSKLGGVHWGIAVSDGRVYVPIADPPFPIPGYAPRPGVYALSVDDGRVLWEHPIERGCETDLIAYFQRDRLYPECSFWFGPSNAPLALPGVLVVGALDGQLRALSTQDGGELWRFATLRPYESVNGVPAHGGSIDAAPAIAVGNTLYVQSGYGLFGHLPGNALLAFALP
jgi:polyvinyl alcohol dehydrogenase (cytochrome)